MEDLSLYCVEAMPYVNDEYPFGHLSDTNALELLADTQTTTRVIMDNKHVDDEITIPWHAGLLVAVTHEQIEAKAEALIAEYHSRVDRKITFVNQ